jgi:hypothetical protein
VVALDDYFAGRGEWSLDGFLNTFSRQRPL